MQAYEGSCLAKDSRKRMDDMYYGTKAVNEVAVLVSIVFEGGFCF
jgi:hypothetical protein